MLAVVLCVWGMFRMAGVIERLLGKTGIVVMTRILGMLLASAVHSVYFGRVNRFWDCRRVNPAPIIRL